MNFNRIIIITLFIIFSINKYVLKSQDTLFVNINSADSIFLKNNLSLIASTMNIKAQQALIIQSRVYPNPIFTADFNAYDPQNNKILHVNNTGQKSFQLEQLLLIGGKRKTEIEIAKTNAKIAELEFQELLVQLKYKLHSNIFSIGQIYSLLTRYNQQLNLLETLLNSYEIQVQKGNLPLKDLVRLKGAYLKLNNERSQLLKEYLETQSELQVLLQTSSTIAYKFDEKDIAKYMQSKSLKEIEIIASQNRPELLIMQQNKINAEQNLQYQNKLIIPDINLFTSYDQRGGAFNNQINTGMSFQIPFWNRNQGNIKSAKYKLGEYEYTLNALQIQILTELNNNYKLYIETVSEYQKAKSIYNTDFEITVNGMIENFKKQNVNIVEFIDFFESYNEVLSELIRIKMQLVNSAEKINLLSGKEIF